MTDFEAREHLRYLAGCHEAIADSGGLEERLSAARRKAWCSASLARPRFACSST